MTPEAFVSKWSQTTTKERAAAQEHFIDLCGVLDERTPNEADPLGEWYAFEKGVQKTGAGKGWADVWKRSCFGWEYKGKGKNLREALKQLQMYALALESPPLLIVCDLEIIEIHTAFQNAVQEVHVLELQDLLEPAKLQLLKWAFSEPERLRPKRTRNEITEHAASQFANLAFQLRDSGHDPHVVAHFLNKLLFCMFAEDAGLLPKDLFVRLLETGVKTPEHFDTTLRRLFSVMSEGGPFGVEMVSWFNGGLFDSDQTLPLSGEQVRLVLNLAYMDWSQIEPSIFGTLFERGLDPDKRSQLGAHYTDANSIVRLVTPTITEPLLVEWEESKKEIVRHLSQYDKVSSSQAKQNNLKRAENTLQSYLERLRNFRVLDPACGSGNFLYLALLTLKDLEHRANVEAEALGLQRQFLPLVGPDCVLGIELNAYAAELARVTVWIGEIQWMLQHGYQPHRDPILKPLETIEQRDAILESGIEAVWPEVDVVVGNPPFLGSRRVTDVLGEEYVTALRAAYNGLVPNGADLVCYWFYKAQSHLESGKAKRFGLVATQSIRRGASRRVLEKVMESGTIFDAWQDEPWINDGADVRVSLVCATTEAAAQCRLDGSSVASIDAGLTAHTFDLSQAQPLASNLGVAFQGIIPRGRFDVDDEVARAWFGVSNVNGKTNADVLRPFIIARDLTGRPRDKWIIDFSENSSEMEAAQYEIPFEHVRAHVYGARQQTRQKRSRERWWVYERYRREMREAVSGLSRYIATPRVSKHRLYRWYPTVVLPDARLYVIAREDDATFGVLHSRIHEVWALANSSRHGVGNDPTYNATSCFESFPFPDGLTMDLAPSEFDNSGAQQISNAANELSRLRENWLNPPEWSTESPGPSANCPVRVDALPPHEAELKKRTLTELYNQKPSWLELIHESLNRAVFAAYGWDEGLSDNEILEALLALNLRRPN